MAFLEQITPIILTYNEAPNIGRLLERLTWAPDVVVVDSLSTDETPSITRRFPEVRLFQRTFDTHSKQWNFALHETAIRTEWVLALDADYQVTHELVEELKELCPPDSVAGYTVRFRYCMMGRPLRHCLYPPTVVLYRKNRAHYLQDGHTQKLIVEGPISNLKAFMDHDDRKSFRRWLASQDRYARLEAQKLIASRFSELDWPDRMRKLRIVFPWLIFIHCLFGKGLIFDGIPGVHYAFERMLAECFLSFSLLKSDFRRLSATRPKHAAQ
jgi:glycosyltransferase involved in cell wall biosynthesis